MCVITGTEEQKNKVNYPYPFSGKEYDALRPEEKAQVDNAPMEQNKFDATKTVPKKQNYLLIQFKGKNGEQFGKYDLSYKLWPQAGQDLRNFLRKLGVDPAILVGDVDIDPHVIGKEFKATVAPDDEKGYQHIDRDTVRPVNETAEDVAKQEADIDIKLLEYITANNIKPAELSAAKIFDIYKKDATFKALGQPNDILKAAKKLQA